jgi:hypothetical protein
MVKILLPEKERNTGNAFLKVFFLVIFAFHAVPVFALQDTPSSSIGISGGPIFAIAVPSDSSDAVYVGTGEGIFKSVSGEDLFDLYSNKTNPAIKRLILIAKPKIQNLSIFISKRNRKN